MKKDVTEIKDTSRIKYLIKGVLFTYIFTFLLILIYSILLTYTNIPDSSIPSFVVGIGITSVLMSSVIFCRQIGMSGLINGGIIGTTYIVLIYIVSSFVNVEFSLDKYAIFMIIISIVTGGIGGIIGVNFSKNNR